MTRLPDTCVELATQRDCPEAVLVARQVIPVPVHSARPTIAPNLPLAEVVLKPSSELGRPAVPSQGARP